MKHKYKKHIIIEHEKCVGHLRIGHFCLVWIADRYIIILSSVVTCIINISKYI